MTLAMIEEFSGLSVCVFDEPTYGVDADSRKKLVWDFFCAEGVMLGLLGTWLARKSAKDCENGSRFVADLSIGVILGGDDLRADAVH